MSATFLAGIESEIQVQYPVLKQSSGPLVLLALLEPAVCPFAWSDLDS